MKTARRIPHLHRIVNTAGLLMLCGIFAESLIDLLSRNNEGYFPLLAVSLPLFFFLALWICKRIKNEATFLILLLTVTFLLRLAWVLAIDTKPESDFLILYHASLKGAAGDFSFNAETYFLMWPYQMGFTLYQSLVIHLFGAGTFMLKVFNCLVTTGTTLLVYQTGKLIFNKSSGKAAGVLYGFYVPCIIMNSLLSNQQLSTFLFYLGFHIMLKQFGKKNFSWLWTGLLFALGHAVRPLATVVIPCVLLYQLIYAVCMKNKDRMAIVKKTAFALVVFFVVFQAAGYALVKTGVSPYGLQNRDPLWKFVTGLNPDTSGQYSEPDIKYLKQFPLGSAERKAEETAIIQGRISDPGKLLGLLGRKYAIFWGTRDAFTYWTLGPDHPTLSAFFGLTEQLMYLYGVFFGILALWRLLGKRSVKSGFYILLLLLYAGAHLLIEIQTRYREFVIPIIILFFGYGISSFYAFMKEKINRKSALRRKETLSKL